MIILHQLPPLDRAPSLSPFCVKVELYMRMTNVAHRVVYTVDSSAGPKAKLPFIEVDGTRLGDSYFIIEQLKRTHGDALDADLGARDRATALAFSRMLDEHLYWAIVHSRWMDDRFSPRMIDALLGGLPIETRAVVGPMAIDGLAKALQAHGMGRHGHDEIVARAGADLSALATLLGDRPFMLGDRPTTLDAAAFGALTNLLDVELDTPLKRLTGEQANLCAYTERIRERYFSTSA